MRADTRTISIDAPAEQVIAFVANLQNLPRWAVGFAKAVERTPNGWVVHTGAGEMGVRVDTEFKAGTVDFWMSPVPGIEVLAASRILPRGVGSEFVFTQFQGPGMPDAVFEQNVRALTHELSVLKALMEVECPL
jgi:hypothetical protein